MTNEDFLTRHSALIETAKQQWASFTEDKPATHAETEANRRSYMDTLGLLKAAYVEDGLPAGDIETGSKDEKNSNFHHIFEAITGLKSFPARAVV